MNPKAVLLISLVVLAAFALLLWLIIWWVGRQAGVRQKDYKFANEHYKLARAELDKIIGELDNYRDFQDPDSVLANTLRTSLRTYEQKARGIKR